MCVKFFFTSASHEYSQLEFYIIILWWRVAVSEDSWNLYKVSESANYELEYQVWCAMQVMVIYTLKQSGKWNLMELILN